jgi:hypothetical protein
MTIWTSLVHVTTLALVLAQGAWAQGDPPPARILSVNLDPSSVTVLRLRTGYVSSVRLPEAVNAVVLGDPVAFKAEHSEVEPQLVFFKPSSPRPAKTNALITTRTGHAISLSLISEGNSDRDGAVDYILEYERPRIFLIEPAHSSFLIGETKSLTPEDPPIAKASSDSLQSIAQPSANAPHWAGKQLRVTVGQTQERDQELTVAFSVLNSSSRAIELLPPQMQLSGTAKQKHHKAIKAQPVAIKDYRMNSRHLGPGESTDGVVAFERPAFKESRERLLLEIAQAEEVDRPVLAPIAFVGLAKGAAK